MGFFDFNQNDLLPYSRTKAGKHDAKIAENMKIMQENMKNEKQINAYKEQVQKDLLFEANAKNSVNTRSINRRRRIQEDIKLEETLTKKTLSKYLAEMVISGLVFDEDFIEAKHEGLSNKLTSYIENMFNEGAISYESFTNNGNLLMESAYYELTSLVKEKIRNRDTVDIFSEATILDILNEADKAKNTSDDIADSVKKKVTDTIKEEKKISKKKEEEKNDEKELNKEFADAADSLDTNKKDPDAEGSDDDEELDDNGDSEDTDEDMDDVDGEDDDDMSDEELDQMDKETDGEELDPDDEGLDDLDEDDDIDSEDSESDGNDDTDKDMDDDLDSEDKPDLDANAETSANGTMKITVETDGKKVSVEANQSESVEYLNLFGKSRYQERNSKTLFRNLLEGNILHVSNVLTESTNENGINMDTVLAETITEYTLLETMFTSKIFNLSPSQLKSLMKSINFTRK